MPRSHIAELIDRRLHHLAARVGSGVSRLWICVPAPAAWPYCWRWPSPMRRSTQLISRPRLWRLRAAMSTSMAWPSASAWCAPICSTRWRAGAISSSSATRPTWTRSRCERSREEYRREPALALAGGKDGLDAVRRILAQARAHLAPRRRARDRGGERSAGSRRGFPRSATYLAGDQRGRRSGFLGRARPASCRTLIGRPGAGSGCGATSVADQAINAAV